MKLTLKSIQTKDGKELTVEQAKKYLASKEIKLPESLYLQLVDSYIKRQGKVKNSVPSNEVFLSNNI